MDVDAVADASAAPVADHSEATSAAGAIVDWLLTTVCAPEPTVDVMHNWRKVQPVIERAWATGAVHPSPDPGPYVARVEVAPGVSVAQLSTHKQRRSGPCGYYALFNALCLCMCIHAEDDANAETALRKLMSGTSFWRRYFRTLNALKAHARLLGSHWWPWTEQDIDEGELERVYMHHLLSTDTTLLALDGAHGFQLLHYGYGVFQQSMAHLIRSQHRIIEFCAARTDKLAFLLGVTNHWVALVANKVDGELELCYMDSNNLPVLSSSRAQLLHIILQKNEDRALCGTEPWTDREVSRILQSLLDQATVVRILAACCAGRASLLRVALDSNLRKLVAGYERRVWRPFLRMLREAGVGLDGLAGADEDASADEEDAGALHALAPVVQAAVAGEGADATAMRPQRPRSPAATAAEHVRDRMRMDEMANDAHADGPRTLRRSLSVQAHALAQRNDDVLYQLRMGVAARDVVHDRELPYAVALHYADACQSASVGLVQPSPPLSVDLSDNFVALMIDWLENWTRPQSMRDGMVKTLRLLGAQYMSPRHRAVMAKWAEQLRWCGTHAKAMGVRVLEVFCTDVLDALLEVHASSPPSPAAAPPPPPLEHADAAEMSGGWD